MLKNLQHINIVRLIDHSIAPDHATIVMEYCVRGDLRSLLEDAESNKQALFVPNVPFTHRTGSRSHSTLSSTSLVK